MSHTTARQAAKPMFLFTVLLPYSCVFMKSLVRKLDSEWNRNVLQQVTV